MSVVSLAVEARHQGPAEFATDETGPTPAARWGDLVRGFGVLGRVWLITAGPAFEDPLRSSRRPAFRLAHRCGLGGIRVRAPGASLARAELSLRLLFEHWSTLRSGGDAGLAVEDAEGWPLFEVRLGVEADPMRLRLLLATASEQRAHGGGPPPAGADRARLRAWLDQGAASACGERSAEDGLGAVDVGELSGRQRMRPAWLLERGAIAVDPSLVPCALEVLADQTLPLSILSGSAGMVRRDELSFYGHRRHDGRFWLRGDDGRLELETEALGHAWVVPGDDPHGNARALRLYEEQGQALAVIRPAASRSGCVASAGDEPAIWRSLMNALCD